MGGTGFVDRDAELAALSSALDGAASGRAGLRILKGETGSGKTRLAEEALRRAAERGFEVARGDAVAESVEVYLAWGGLLGSLGLAHLLDPAPPPRLLGLYVVSASGLLAQRVEREGTRADADLFAAMTTAVTEFISQALGDARSGHGLLRMSHGERGLVVRRGNGFAVAAVIEGRETESLLADLAELCETVDGAAGELIRGWDGRVSSVAPASEPLRRLLETGRYEGAGSGPQDPRARQDNLFHAVALGLGRRAESRPLALLIEDLQWADPSSLALLQYAARNLSRSRVLIIATHRSDGTALPDHLAAALSSIRREFGDCELELRGLPADGVRELLTTVIGASPPAGLAEALSEKTGGNPLFTIEAAEELIARKSMVVEHGRARLLVPPEAIELPGRALEMLRARLERLSEDERALLEAAAVVGPRFTVPSLASLMGESPPKLLRVAHALTRSRGLLRAEGGGFAFDQPSVREATYSGMPADLRKEYHRATAEAFSSSGGADVEVGEHFYRAGDARCVAPLARAAERALAEFANEEAARLLRQAAEHATGPERDALTEKLTQALWLSGRFQEIIDLCARAEVKDDVSRLRMAAREVEALEKLGRTVEALEKVEVHLRSASGELRADLLRTRASALVEKGRLDEAIASIKEALVLIPEGSAPKVRGGVLNSLGIALHTRSDYAGAVEAYEAARTEHLRAGNLRGAAGALQNIGTTLAERGDREGGLARFREALAVMEQSGSRDGAAVIMTNMSILERIVGMPDEAEEHLRRALAIHESTGSRQGMAAGLASLGNMRLVMGDRAGARSCYERSLEISRKYGLRYMEGVALADLSAMDLERGLDGAAEALARSRESASILGSLGDRLMRTSAASVEARALAVLGRGTEARAVAEEAARIARGLGAKVEEAKCLSSLALAHASLGEPEAARDAASRALAALGDQPAAGEDLADLLLALADVEDMLGDRARAAAHAGRSADAYERLKLAARAAEARLKAASSGRTPA